MKRYRHYTKDLAIILSCFGSIIEQDLYEDLRKKVKDDFSEAEVFISYSSRMVLKKLAKQNLHYNNLNEVLAKCDREGFKKIIVASINLFPTDEHNLLVETVKGFKSFTPINIRATDAIFTKTKETSLFLNYLFKSINKDDTFNLFIIHGVPRLDIIGLESVNYVKNYLEFLSQNNLVISLEGEFPFYALKDRLVEVIKNKGFEKIQIIPMLLVSGNHYIKDMNEINEFFNQYFSSSIVPPLNETDRFNLLSLDEIYKIIKQNISIELIKLGC